MIKLDKSERLKVIKNLNKSIDLVEKGICPDCKSDELLGLFLSGNNLDDVSECLNCGEIFNINSMIRDLRILQMG